MKTIIMVVSTMLLVGCAATPLPEEQLGPITTDIVDDGEEARYQEWIHREAI